MAAIANTPCQVKDARSAQAYLIEKNFITSSADIDKQKVVDILLTATTYKNVSADAQAAIRAIAFLLNEDSEQPPNVQATVTAIEDKISASMKSLTDTVLTTFSDKLDDAQKFIEATTVAQADITLKINQTLSNCTALELSLAAATTKLQTIASPPVPAQGTRSWADVAATPTNTNIPPQGAYNPTQAPETTRLQQRLLLRTRMVMINSLDTIKNPATEMRETANVWLKEIDDFSEDDPKPNTIIRTAALQSRGGLLLEFDSSDSANRFRYYIATSPDLKEKFGPEAAISELTYKLVMRFIPCDGGFEPSNPDHLRVIEEYNGLEAFSIVSITWCRPITKRAANQSFATATAFISSAQSANRILHDNFYISDKRITVQKDTRQPLLCNKCQQYGHIRRECPNDLRCSTCASSHDIGSCTNRDRPNCVSCGPASQHPSNDHQCPAFQRRMSDLNKRFPDDALPHFPVHDDPSTWVGAPAGPLAPPPQYNRPPRSIYPQQSQTNQRRDYMPNGATELFLRQQSLYEVNGRRQQPPHNPYNPPHRLNGPPIVNAPSRPPAPILPSQPRDDSIDREIMDTDTITTRARSNAGPLPQKPQATFEDSLPPSVSQ